MLPALTSYLAAEQSESVDGHLLIPHTYDLFWGAVAFVVIAVLFWKFALPKYLELVDARAAKIEQGVANAEAAQAEVEAARGKLNEEILNARKQAAQIKEDATRDAKKIADRLQSDAQMEANRVVENASARIALDKQSAKEDLRSYTGQVALELSSRILGEELNKADVQARVIDRFLDELESQTADYHQGQLGDK